MFIVGVLAFLLGSALTASAETAPVAVDDYAETDGKTVHIDVLGNDSGDFDPSTLTLASQASLGSAVVIATGSPKIKYSASGPGTDTFQYSVCNSAGACSTATVTVNIAVVGTTTTTVTTTTVAPPQSPTTTTFPAIEAAPTTAPPATTSVTPVTTATTTPSTTLPAVSPMTTNAPPDPFADLSVGSGHPLAEAGTTVGEPHKMDIVEDVRFLGRSGADTLKLVAVPAVMVSGIVGFLLIGLPQNALGGLLGFLVGRRRRDEEERDDPET